MTGITASKARKLIANKYCDDYEKLLDFIEKSAKKGYNEADMAIRLLDKYVEDLRKRGFSVKVFEKEGWIRVRW